MTVSRAALYLGGASLLVAWLSSANSLSPDREPPPADAAAEAAEPAADLSAAIRSDVQRLRARLASAPRPQPTRNPFTFDPVRVGRPARTGPAAASPLPPAPEAVPAEPALALIGVAEYRRPRASVRTALISAAGDELIMAEVGDTVLQRYTVVQIGAGSVDLADAATGRPLRLVLP